MIKTEHSTMINRPVGQVWMFMSDVEKVTQNIRATVVQTSEGPLGVGSTFRLTNKVLGRVRTGDLCVSEWEPSKKMVFLGEFGLAKSSLSFEFESVNGKTRFTRVSEVEMRGLWKLLQPLLARRIRNGTRREMANWKQQLESQVAA